MKVLALDPSARTGYAFGDVLKSNSGIPFSGTFEAPRGPLTHKMVALERWAIELIRENGIQEVHIEEPILPRVTTFSSVSQVAGMAFMLGVAATKCGCFCSLIAMQTWRSKIGVPTQGPKDVLKDPHYAAKFAHRKGGGLKEAKRQFVKDRTMDFVRKMGSDPKDDNESDAIAIWHAVAAMKRAKIEAPGFDFERDLTI